MNILGLSFGFHESAACLVQDGRLVFACAEERLSRKKLDSAFPVRAIQAALDFAGLTPGDVDHIAIGWPRPWEGYAHSLKLLLTGRMPASLMRWERLLLGFAKAIRHRGGELDFIRAFGRPRHKVHFIHHHLAHALSAYCLSGFDEAAVLVADGCGAREATTLWHAADGEAPRGRVGVRASAGRGSLKAERRGLGGLWLLEQIDYPNSIGLFYARLTQFLGFQPFSDEWKVMGLASYGQPTFDLSRLIRVTEDGYELAARRFFGRRDDDLSALEIVLGPKRNGEELSARHQDLARSAQDACEAALHALLRRLTRLTGCRRLCLAGGVALNCKANGELLRSGLIDDIYVQPAAGDDGTCIGAALAVYPKLGLPLPRQPLGHTYLGPEFSNEQIENTLQVFKLPYRRVANPAHIAAELLAANRLVGWFQGRMEFGPRALGNRSILAHPGFRENTDRVNEAVKFRESWRPFAPSVLEEEAPRYFNDFYHSPYMILSFWANKRRASEIPAVVHVDGSCRVQSVTRAANPLYYALLQRFHALTGLPVVLNTSFNLKGDPIVCSPRDAIQTFYTSGLDDLVIGDFVVSKNSSELTRLVRA
jgi:carbamoyltransferase